MPESATVPEVLATAVAALGGEERPGQVEMAEAVNNIIKDGGLALIEAGTGTGKTLLSAAVIKLFLRTGNAARVLFLVDRLRELETALAVERVKREAAERLATERLDRVDDLRRALRVLEPAPVQPQLTTGREQAARARWWPRRG